SRRGKDGVDRHGLRYEGRHTQRESNDETQSGPVLKHLGYLHLVGVRCTMASRMSSLTERRPPPCANRQGGAPYRFRQSVTGPPGLRGPEPRSPPASCEPISHLERA